MVAALKRSYDEMIGSPSQAEIRAAKTIQKSVRIYLEKVLKGYKVACANLSNDLRAEGGNRSAVYLSKEMSGVVIKGNRPGLSFNPNDQLEKTHKIRQILKQQGSTRAFSLK